MDETNILDRLLGNKYIVLIILCVLFLNAVVIDILFFSSKKEIPQCSQNCPLQYLQVTPTSLPHPSISAGAQDVTATPSPTSLKTSAAATATPIPTPTSTPAALREYFIPLGQGSGNYADWAVVPGIGAKINTANYGEITAVYFEASVRTPTGNQSVEVRLYNANNYQSVQDSNLALQGGATTLLTSGQIILTGGENLYQVQLKTQLQYPTYIDQARIRIVSR